MEEFGNRLREALVSAGLTQAALAKELGVHANVVNNWACGKGYPSLENLARLAPALGVGADWLIFGGSPPPVSPRANPVVERVRTLGPDLIRLVELAEGAG